jgi:hypothetical protein
MSSSTRSSRRRTARLCGPFAAALAFGALAAAPASATVSTTNPVEAGENITVFHNIDFVAGFGIGAIGDVVDYEIIRNGVVIGETSGPLVDAEGQPGLEANHGPEGAPVAGDCWVGHTPDIRPGDLVRITNTVSGDVDEVTVDQIEFVGDPQLLPNGDVIQNGIALRADGTPIPTTALDSNGFLDTSKFRGPADEVRPWAARPGGFTNVFHPPYNMERNEIYPTLEERRSSLLNNGGHEAGFGHVDPLPLESMLLDGNADDPSAAPGCEGSPAESNRVSSAPSHLNATTGDVTISGLRMTSAGAGAVEVSLTDGAGNVAGPFAATETGNDWTVTVTAAERAGLADGTITVAGAYDHGGTALTGKTAEIQKDTVAPTLSATPNAGTFTGATSVALTAGPGEQIRYRTDGAIPSASDTLYNGAIPLPFGTTTLGVRVSDEAGNVITRTLTYTVNRPPVAAAAPAPAPAPAPALPPVIQQLSVPNSAPVVRLAATARQSTRAKLGTVRKSGLRLAFTAPQGARVMTARLYRVSGSSRRLVSSRTQSIRSGRRSVRFAGKRLRTGRYLVKLQVGASRSTLGAVRNINIQIVR